MEVAVMEKIEAPRRCFGSTLMRFSGAVLCIVGTVAACESLSQTVRPCMVPCVSLRFD